MVGGAEETLEEEEGLFMLLAVVEERDIVEHRCRHARNTTSLIHAHATCTVPADLNLRCTHRHGDERTWGMVRVGAQRAHVPESRAVAGGTHHAIATFGDCVPLAKALVGPRRRIGSIKTVRLMAILRPVRLLLTPRMVDNR